MGELLSSPTIYLHVSAVYARWWAVWIAVMSKLTVTMHRLTSISQRENEEEPRKHTEEREAA